MSGVQTMQWTDLLVEALTQALAGSENPGQDSHDPKKVEADADDADDADDEPILCDREVQTEMQVHRDAATSNSI